MSWGVQLSAFDLRSMYIGGCGKLVAGRAKLIYMLVSRWPGLRLGQGGRLG